MKRGTRHHHLIPAPDRKLLYAFLIIGTILATVVFLYPAAKSEPKVAPASVAPTDEPTQSLTASFVIYTNGTRREFTDPKYHNTSGDLFIDASSPHTIRVREEGRVWSDFFNTLPMQVTPVCLTTGTGQQFCTDSTQSLKFFINGTEDQNALEREIRPGDKLLISYGPKNDPEIPSQLSAVPEPQP